MDRLVVNAFHHVVSAPDGPRLMARAFALTRERPEMLADDGGRQALHALLYREVADLSDTESADQELVSSAMIAARYLYTRDQSAQA